MEALQQLSVFTRKQDAGFWNDRIGRENVHFHIDYVQTIKNLEFSIETAASLPAILKVKHFIVFDNVLTEENIDEMEEMLEDLDFDTTRMINILCLRDYKKNGDLVAKWQIRALRDPNNSPVLQVYVGDSL